MLLPCPPAARRCLPNDEQYPGMTQNQTREARRSSSPVTVVVATPIASAMTDRQSVTYTLSPQFELLSDLSRFIKIYQPSKVYMATTGRRGWSAELANCKWPGHSGSVTLSSCRLRAQSPFVWEMVGVGS